MERGKETPPRKNLGDFGKMKNFCEPGGQLGDFALGRVKKFSSEFRFLQVVDFIGLLENKSASMR